MSGEKDNPINSELYATVQRICAPTLPLTDETIFPVSAMLLGVIRLPGLQICSAHIYPRNRYV